MGRTPFKSLYSKTLSRVIPLTWRCPNHYILWSFVAPHNIHTRRDATSRHFKLFLLQLQRTVPEFLMWRLIDLILQVRSVHDGTMTGWLLVLVGIATLAADVFHERTAAERVNKEKRKTAIMRVQWVRVGQLEPGITIRMQEGWIRSPCILNTVHWILEKCCILGFCRVIVQVGMWPWGDVLVSAANV